MCFDEGQLEQVFEYPSEASLLVFSPDLYDLLKLHGKLPWDGV